ncbi:unnamed protein product [Hermetia illucens]|uniref:Coiled-coil domain-containing protein n=1 Tax=Hermetia illucens TaxID=343691 RepID=A0A7R8UPZ3_HERIL|nr:coiled-coil domain-containing protein 124 [Hermetia illucens]CAD7084650.1 unnamed protein product [Hermetia illucens]
MPKKLGENTKAVEARERKQAAKKAAQDKAAKEAEDRLWKDDDKQLAKKKSRKEEEERRKNEQLRRKAESKALLEQEMASIKTNAKQPIHKVTRQQIQQEVEQRNKNIEVINAPKVAPKVTVQDPLEENLNRVMADTVIATNVDEAIAALSVSDTSDDKHPEKRMRAAFKAFEAENLPRIKAENPTLRLSQWKQILMKEWNKSPDNPMNNRV